MVTRGTASFGSHRRRQELLVGFVLICGGGLVAAMVAGSGGSGTSAPTSVASVVPAPVEPLPSVGRTLTASSLSPGEFPPSLAPGAVVRVIAIGGPDPLDSSVRAFPGEVVVEDVSAAEDGSSDVVVTMAADESLGDFVASAGSVRLTIVGGRP